MSRLDAVIGLGNPGSRYAHTYHNVGFQAIDRLASTYSHQKKNDSEGELFSLKDGPADYLGKPGRMMNRSGQAVSAWTNEMNWSPASLLIIYDDFSIDVGQIRIRPGGSAGGHNGLSGILKQLGTNDIPRLRLGIGPVSPGGDPAEFVLSKIISDDRKIFHNIFRQLPQILKDVTNNGCEFAMNRWNGVDWDE